MSLKFKMYKKLHLMSLTLRNGLVFNGNGKRWFIPEVVNKARIDLKLWTDALKEEENHREELKKNLKENDQKADYNIPVTVQDAIARAFVDGSWVSEDQQAGIGWTLYNREEKQLLKGSASINPCLSPLEVEAKALRMAITQIKRLGFDVVTFCGDSTELYKPLQSDQLYQDGSRWKHLPIATYVGDILTLARSAKNYRFMLIKREANGVADLLSKCAKATLQDYVISWVM